MILVSEKKIAAWPTHQQRFPLYDKWLNVLQQVESYQG